MHAFVSSLDGELHVKIILSLTGVSSPGETVNVAFVDPRGSVVRVACEIGESNSVMMGSDGACSF
jgi:hypothetical protein